MAPTLNRKRGLVRNQDVSFSGPRSRHGSHATPDDADRYAAPTIYGDKPYPTASTVPFKSWMPATTASIGFLRRTSAEKARSASA
jgi:hypothetical protein